MMGSTIIDLSSSMSLYIDKKDHDTDRLKWSSISNFVYLACTSSTSMYNFDIFAKVCDKIRIFDFVFLEIVIGMTYMFMECFIKQYSRKVSSDRLLNPLLKGISFGLFLQTAIWALLAHSLLLPHSGALSTAVFTINDTRTLKMSAYLSNKITHANYMADALRFLIISLQNVSSWSTCTKSDCIPSSEIIIRCRSGDFIDFNKSSSHHNYIQSFTHLDRSVLTTRLFVIALVWLFNFFLSTVSDDTLIKIFRLSFWCRMITTMGTFIFMVVSIRKESSISAFVQILNASAPNSYTSSVEHVTYIYGIGFLGLYDFGKTSSSTPVDNAVVLFTIIFTAIAFIRSWIVRILYIMVTKCVSIGSSVTPHYLLFAILPLSTEFLYAHKLYIFYIYLNVMVATTSYLIMLTKAMAKFLSNEFRSVKSLYLVGVLSCMGLILSVPITIMSFSLSNRVSGIIAGVNVNVLYLGSFRSAIIMWVYGVKRFSTDIQFWLGFKPTRFWRTCWLLLPIVLGGFLINKIVQLTKITSIKEPAYYALCWIILTILIVTITQIKTISKFLVWNNVAGIFAASSRYGPADPEDRKRRVNFNEILRHRKCDHNCCNLDATSAMVIQSAVLSIPLSLPISPMGALHYICRDEVSTREFFYYLRLLEIVECNHLLLTELHGRSDSIISTASFTKTLLENPDLHKRTPSKEIVSTFFNE